MEISDLTFKRFKDLIYQEAGIHLADTKKQMVSARLMKRLRVLQLSGFEEYYKLASQQPSELQTMIDLLTTNETSFFREPAHFDFLQNEILQKFNGTQFRAWSAAASIGAEAYTLAMVLDDNLSKRHIKFDIIGTDINVDVINRAKNGIYPINFASKIDIKFLKKYCLEGHNTQNGFFMIDDYLRHKCSFLNANLMKPLPSNLGQFDVIFLRNMLIYFDIANKKIIVENIIKLLKSGGYLFIGHSETLTNVTTQVRQVKPTIYIKD